MIGVHVMNERAGGGDPVHHRDRQCHRLSTGRQSLSQNQMCETLWTLSAEDGDAGIRAGALYDLAEAVAHVAGLQRARIGSNVC